MVRVVSLFSGAGGLDLGFKLSGFSVVFANDVLEPPMRTYARAFGLKFRRCSRGVHSAEAGEALVCDVEKVDFRNLAAEVVVGGPPCQDFSIVRGPDWERRGIEVKRGRLYMHFLRALAQIQPLVFVFENVPGLVSANKGVAYKTIISDLTNLKTRWAGGNGAPPNYRVVFSGVVDFSHFGVPQKRERLIIVGVREDVYSRDMEKIASRLASGGIFAQYPLTPLEVFEGRPLPELQDVYTKVMEKWAGVWEEVATARATEWKAKVWDRLTFDVVKDYAATNGMSKLPNEEVWRAHESVLKELGYYGVKVCSEPLPDGTCEVPDEGPSVRERMRRIPPGENHEFLRGTKWEVEGRGISLIYRRIHPLRPAYTIVAYGGGGTHGYHYDRDRATLTLRERARLQTFPDSFLFFGSRSAIRAQIGEAVPPLAAKRIAEVVDEILRAI